MLCSQAPLRMAPLPLAEVWEELQAGMERLMGEVGLKILRAILED